MFHGGGETETGHVAINTFELVGVDRIGLVPDTDGSIRADELVEFLPGSQMRIGWVARKIFKVFERTPVLDQHGTAKIPKELSVQEALFRITEQCLQHWRHGIGDRQPFVESPPLVNAHPDQKDYEGLVCFGCVSSVKNLAHHLLLDKLFCDGFDFVDVEFITALSERRQVALYFQ